MEHKIDIERVILTADPVKQTDFFRFKNVIYVSVVLTSIVLGAFAMSLVYHWQDIRTTDVRLKVQEVDEVIRLANVLLNKYDTNAVNIEKLVTLVQQTPSRPHHGVSESNPHFESNPDQAEHHVNNDNPLDILPSVAGPTTDEGKLSNNKTDLSTELNAEETDEAKDVVGEGQSDEIFRWKWSFPRSAWLQLLPYAINVGTSTDSNENTVVSNESV